MPKRVDCIEMEVVAPKSKKIHPARDFASHVESVVDDLKEGESVTIKFTRASFTKEEFDYMCEASH